MLEEISEFGIGLFSKDDRFSHHKNVKFIHADIIRHTVFEYKCFLSHNIFKKRQKIQKFPQKNQNRY